MLEPIASTDPIADCPADSTAELYQHIHSYIKTRCAASPLYAFLLPNDILRLTHVSPGHIIARIPVMPFHLNSAGSLHGSTSATIVDWAGGLAVAAWDQRATTGVSVDIHITYLSGKKDGEIEIEGKVDRVGNNLAFTNVGIYQVRDDGTRGEPVALGRHTKYVRGTAPKQQV